MEHGKALGRAAFGGGLYGQTLASAVALANAVPGGGPVATGLQLAELNRTTGGAGTGALRAMRPTGNSPVDEVARQAIDGVVRTSEVLAAKLDGVRTELDSLGAAMDGIKLAAFGAEQMGGLEGGAELFTNLRRVREFQMRMEGIRDRRAQSYIASGITSQVPDAMRRAFAGSTGR